MISGETSGTEGFCIIIPDDNESRENAQHPPHTVTIILLHTNHATKLHRPGPMECHAVCSPGLCTQQRCIQQSNGHLSRFGDLRLKRHAAKAGHLKADQEAAAQHLTCWRLSHGWLQTRAQRTSPPAPSMGWGQHWRPLPSSQASIEVLVSSDGKESACSAGDQGLTLGQEDTWRRE